MNRYFEDPDEVVRTEPHSGSDVILVGFDEFKITDSESRIPYVGTTELATCVATAVYNPDECVGAVSHSIPYTGALDSGGNIVVEEMLSELESNYNLDYVSARIVTGSSPNPDNLNQVNYSLEESDIVEEDIEWINMTDENGPTSSGSVVLNTLNGHIEPLPWLF